MKEEEFKKGIEKIKNIKLKSYEKEEILARVLNMPVKSPFTPKFSFWAAWLHQSRVAYVFALLFVMVSVGSVLAYSAEKSLPGEKLYALKVGLTEPIRDAANVSPEDKAEWESAKTVRRLDEALKLAAEGKLDEKNRTDLEKRFNEHTEAFTISLQSISTSSEKTDLIEIEFEADLSAKAKVFEDWAKKSKERSAKEKIQNTGVATSTRSEMEDEDEDKDQEAELKKFKETVFEKIEKRKNSRKSSNEDSKEGRD